MSNELVDAAFADLLDSMRAPPHDEILIRSKAEKLVEAAFAELLAGIRAMPRDELLTKVGVTPAAKSGAMVPSLRRCECRPSIAPDTAMCEDGRTILISDPADEPQWHESWTLPDWMWFDSDEVIVRIAPDLSQLSVEGGSYPLPILVAPPAAQQSAVQRHMSGATNG